MDDQFNEIDLSPQPVLRQRRIRTGALLVGLTALAVLAAACFVWFDFDRATHAFLAEAQSGAPAVVEQEVSLQDFLAFQQQSTESLEKINQDIAAQKAELKRLADQVSVLSGKFDSLQSTIAAQAASPPSAAPPQPPVLAARKRPPATKPTSRISIGGAPLPPNPDDH